MKIFKIIILSVLILMSLLIGGCSFDSVVPDIGETYSRNDTQFASESDSFGKGRSDDIYVALDYVYSDEEIKAKHGSDFEITVNDVVCHTSETKNFIFKSLYTGNADYSITVNDSTYRVKLSKEMFGVWNVTECNLDE